MEKKKHLKIAFLSFYSGVLPRGVETYAHEVANRLTDMGNQVVVYQNGPSIDGAKYKTVQIFMSVNWKINNETLSGTLYFVGKVRQFTKIALSKIDKDTEIIIPTNGRWQSVLSKIWSIKNGKKLVIPGQSGKGIDDRVNLYTFPDIYISLTKYQEKWANSVNPFVKTVKIPNGVDLSKFERGKSSALNIELPRPIILCVAALVPYKRLDLAVKAVSRLNKGSLLLVGAGPGQGKLVVMGKELLPGRFKIMSFLHKDMPKVYKAADLFTFPTYKWESFGIVQLEAMASGLAVVASDDPIRREIIGSSGLFVNPEHTQEYAEALQKALDTDWGEKPRKQAERFSWDEVAKKYEKLFLEVAR